ncbi:MAG: helix-turn-helix domain-containing protein [Clostridia bacterium]
MISDRLRRFRKSYKITQQDLSMLLGVDRTTYTFYETGATQPSIKTLCGLAKIYDVSIGYLIGVEENLKNNTEKVQAFSPVRLNQSFKIDPIANLERNEKNLLLSYRLLSEERKEEALQLIKDIIEEDDTGDEI